MADTCPRCGAPEVESNAPRTTYACGSSDYDRRTGTIRGKCKRYCMHCLRRGGSGPRELRPYGPGGRDVCAQCTFQGPPDRREEAERQLSARMLTSKPLVLDNREQAGPRPLTDSELAELTEARVEGRQDG